LFFGLYLNPSVFSREAFREKPASIKVLECQDVDYGAAKKEVSGYFEMKGEAYSSEASTDLQLDYELACDMVQRMILTEYASAIIDRKVDGVAMSHD
jgi:hypothetical protein